MQGRRVGALRIGACRLDWTSKITAILKGKKRTRYWNGGAEGGGGGGHFDIYRHN